MSGIDWSKAPVNATHARPYTGGVDFYRRNDGGMWTYWNENRWDYAVGTDESCCVARPVPWTGEGLPPVGIDCETLWSSTTGEYVAVRVVGHDEDRAVVRFIGGDRKGEYDSDRQHDQYGYPIFRPMRSAEERAAEQALNQFIDELTKVTCIRRGEAKLIYEAGYRKVQP